MKPLTPEDATIAWIGVGVMGKSMCGHLIDKGYKAVVTTRTKAKAEPLLEKGATWAETPAEAARNANAVFAIVGFPSDVREVFLGPQGALSTARPGTVLIDMTTSEPSLAAEIHAAAKAKGVHALDAPVSGGDLGARNAALSIMVGGDEKVFEAALPMFEAMGKTIRHHGPAGSGQHCKMVNQALIGPMMIGVCEALLYAHKAGLDPTRVIESVGSGAAGSWSINNLGPRMIKRDFEPGFFVEHFVKDLGIVLAESKKMGLSLPGQALAEQLYLAVKAQGHGKKGTQALMLALEQLAGVKSEERGTRSG